MSDFLGGLITAFVLMFAWAARPERATCPPCWYLDSGIRPSGLFRCVPDLVRDPAGSIDAALQPPGAIEGMIYCTGGSVPIVVDYRTVGCTRRFL
jgi:hypothetical protein